ncbi:unnamed protein product [Aureobasidium uvarum]|uniref:Rhodopsin domain-containing protein n=1 Tax=Aureobasidium uvarum TaxID=2773716 RepID=A0A9N8PRF5_9PEZI|nr:unnamed protein product [Aureobasidium uvarum]
MDVIADAAHRVAALGPRTVVMLVVAVVFLVISWTSFALRVYVRAIMIRSFGKDDWMMLLTICISTTCCGLLISIERIEHGSRPQQALEEGIHAQLDLLNDLMKYIISLMGLYILTTISLKISLAIFFLRIVIRPWQRRIIYTVTGVYTVYATAFAFVAVFQCGIPTNFLIKEATGVCISDDILQPLNYVHASLNAISDWTFACLPVLVLWNAKIPRSAKISSGLLLSLGAVGSIISLIRIAYIPGLKTGPAFFTNAITIGVWSLIEPGLGIVAASLATLRPLFKNMMEKARNSTNPSNSSKSLSHNSRGSLQRKAAFSGAKFSDRGYLQMDDDKKPNKMGNFTSVVGDLKSAPPGQVYELDPIAERPNSMESTRSNSSEDIGMALSGPVIVGSLQNKSWFPDDEVLMTRHVKIDEEAAEWPSPPHR